MERVRQRHTQSKGTETYDRERDRLEEKKRFHRRRNKKIVPNEQPLSGRLIILNDISSLTTAAAAVAGKTGPKKMTNGHRKVRRRQGPRTRMSGDKSGG